MQVFYEWREVGDSFDEEAGSNTRTASSAPRFTFLASQEERIRFLSLKQFPLSFLAISNVLF
jgi:hypothetical protein